MRLNKKINIILIIGIVVLLVGIFVINNQPKETKELPRVKLKEPTKSKQFALMLEQTKGEHDYQESSGELPTEGYKFNKEKSGCVDINGKVVENALDYDYATYTVLLDTSKTLYCYLYYDIDVKIYANLNNALSSKYIYKIVSASFVDYVPSDSELETLTHWDLTDTFLNNGYNTPKNSVIGWLEETEEGTDQYNLYIGSNDTIYVKNLGSTFSYMTNLQEINFDNLNTSETTDMSYMFWDCRNLITLDLSSFDTSKVTDMSYMFYNTSVDLPFKEWPNFVTSSVTNMNGMFESYKGPTLDLSSFDTSKVINMSAMFYSYKGTILDLSSFDTSQVINMSSMFYNTSVDLPFKDWPNFVTTNVEDMSQMFSDYKGPTLDLSTFDTSKVINMSSMFYNTSVDLPFKEWPNFVTTNVEDMSQMFFDYKGTTLDLSSFDTSKVINMSAMFYNTSVDLPFKDWPNFVTTNVEDMSQMFSSYKGPTLDLSSFDTSKVINMSAMFYNASMDLPFKDWSNFVTNSVTNMSLMFGYYEGSSLNLKTFNTSKVKTMEYMFIGYQGTTLDLSSFNTINLENISYMFQECYNLTILDLSSFTFDKVNNISYPFSDIPQSCQVKINSSQQEIFKSKFPLTTNDGDDYNRKFKLPNEE